MIYADLDARLGNGYEFAPMPGGERFLVIREAAAFRNERPEIRVVVNWFEVLKAKLKP